MTIFQMKPKTRQLFLAAAIAALFTFVSADPAARAQAAPPASSGDSALRRLDKPETAAAAVEAQKADPSDDSAPEVKPVRHRHAGDHNNDRVTIGSNNHITASETVAGDAVAVCGDLTVDGRVTGDAVAVCGDNTINGPVSGDAVAVLGDLKLGPKARVDGDIVCVAGTLERDPQAVVGGETVNPSFGGHVHAFAPMHVFLVHGFHSVWWWVLNLLILAFYALVALLFPKAIRSVGDNLTERPGMSILAAFLSVLALPVVFLILIVTVIGIPLAILLLPAFVALMMFGKASLYALLGRKITQDRLHIAIAVVVGGLICLVFFIIPYIGLMLSLLISLLMVGPCVTALFGARKPRTPPPPPVSPTAGTPAPPVPQAFNGPAVSALAAVAPMPSSVDGPVSPMAIPPTPSAEGPSTPPPIQAEPPRMVPPQPAVPVGQPATASMPRAGFWIRTAALLIDLILIGVVLGHFIPQAIPLILAVYGACLWKYRGSTVGGIIFGLRVVRMDDRPIDWPTAIVRALACFLSLIAVGLGFIWVAFDPERQSWHDKIAGTTVVRPPKGVSLV
jgi:uncharacterized RDD family membrane protein YckC